MKYLLDTHVLLWTLFDDDKLSEKAESAIKNPDNSIYASVISYWEISLKYAVGKLELDGVTPDALPGYAVSIGIETLNISENLVSTFYRLPRTAHKDPFDRLIIRQAINENIPLISKDGKIPEYQEYGLKMLWR
ncbi:MAG: type II toxin-antitoxin system VapC family toxin [Desulfococcaceae bacterium]|nr:type II toxin-antitoxin system VapC family toxin [Desulfococcaceae bacterium]